MPASRLPLRPRRDVQVIDKAPLKAAKEAGAALISY